jgi:hypothetical protein
VAGSVGWRIGKDGSSELTVWAVRGTIYASTLIQIYDSNNVLRVRMGLW